MTTDEQLKLREERVKEREDRLEAREKKLDNLIDLFFIGAAILTILIGSYFARGSKSNTGLVCDMAGFLLIFGFGLPSRFATAWDASPKTEMAKNISWIGVVLVTAGFVLQFLGNIKT